jgi:hypothetical protein
MRNGPIDATAWELEAARRREVVEGDFGGSRGTRAGASLRSDANPVRRIAGWFAAITRPNQVEPAARADRTPGCQPGVTAIKTGS